MGISLIIENLHMAKCRHLICEELFCHSLHDISSDQNTNQTANRLSNGSGWERYHDDSTDVTCSDVAFKLYEKRW